MGSILYKVPYEVRVNATDLSSGKAISNLFYLKTANNSVDTATYGNPIAGASSTVTLLTNFKTLFKAQVIILLSIRYSSVSYVMRSILAYKYGTVALPISVGIGVPTTIVTSANHGLATNDLVLITGVTGTASIVNGWRVVTVTGSNSFTIAPNTTGLVWSGGGQEQKAAGKLQFVYGDLTQVDDVQLGGVSGDALPLFSDASVRRLGTFAGKSYQGRNSYAPIGESAQVNGAFTSGAKTSWATNLAALNTFILNGGSDTTGNGVSFIANVSKTLAFTQVTPFTGSDYWSNAVSSMVLRPDLGSFVRRKPKLGALLT